MKTVDVWYSPAELKSKVKLCTKTIIAKLKAREFGPNVVNLGTEQRPDYRVAASGMNAWLKRRALFSDAEPAVEIVDFGVPARTEGELRRKAA